MDMKKDLRFAASAWCVLQCAAAGAQTADRQDPALIQNAASSYLQIQTAGLPGKVTYTVGTVDPRVVLPACPALEVYLPAGAKLWGATSLGVRCNGATPWNIYVTAQVRVMGTYLITARPLAQGQVLAEADISTLEADITQLPATVLTSAQQAVGKTITANLAPGQPLRQDMLRSALVIQQGQSVKLLSSGNGFTVTAEGK